MPAMPFRVGLVVLAALAWSAAVSQAQDFRVITRVYDGRTGIGRAKPVSSSTAIFHAHKVYESVDSAREMTIYEPAHERFVLVDSERKVCTEIAYKFLRDAAQQQEQKANEKALQLERSGVARDVEMANHLKFQAHPLFTTNYNLDTHVLSMEGAMLSYKVKCEEPTVPETAAVYLEYADWAARLNLLVAQTGRLPAARIQLNQFLRERKLLPIEVTAQNHKPERQVTAEHRFEWTLTATDRQQILEWESLLREGKLRKVSFDEYQRGHSKDKEVVRASQH